MINIAIGVVRTKVMAMLLGPAGFGLSGLYLSIANLTQSVAGMGINSSGVRQIALAAGSEDSARIARTVSVLRRTSIILGGLGALLLLVLSREISEVTFKSDRYASGVALLSIAVFFNLVSAGQGALIQGMRRISDLAKVAVLGALFGTLITIPTVYWLRERGIVPSLVAIGAAALITSSFYSRRVKIIAPKLAPMEVWQEARALLKLGFAFMASSLMMMGSAYLVRIAVLQTLGLEATGLYQSAWTLGGLYVGFILQAMGADFYPRLTASSNDHAACNRMVNEQARIGLLLAGPGAIATLTFAPLVISLFYTAKFGPAVELLRWICLGATLRVITWPMGFIILAKGAQNMFFFSDLAWTVVHVGLAWIFLRVFGLNGAGMAFFAAYLFSACLVYPIVRRLTGFRWSSENKKTAGVYLSLIAMVFGSFYVLPLAWSICAGTLAAMFISIYSLRVLLKLVSTERIPRPVQRLFVAFGFMPA
jgi:enterobacterial common antigen flippase